MPGSCIPREVNPFVMSVFTDEYPHHPNHLFRIFLRTVEVRNLI